MSGNQRVFKIRDGGSWLDRCWGARGRLSIPWPGSAPGQRQKQPAFSGCFGQAVRGWGGLRSATATRTSWDRGPLRHHAAGHCYGLSGLVGIDSEQRDVPRTVKITPSSWWDRQFRTVNGFPWVYQHRNGDDGPRVLLGKPAIREWRTTKQSMMEEARKLSLGVSIFLLVVGAILTFAVNVSASGFSINTVGIILMIAGALGLVLSLLFWSSFSPYRRGRTVAGLDTVVEERRIERDLP